MNWMWIKKNQTLLITLAGLLVLIAIGTPLWLYKQEQRQLSASEAYSKALATLKKDDPASEKATRDSLEQIDLPIAKLYAAHLSLKVGEADRAAKAYEAFPVGLGRAANPYEQVTTIGANFHLSQNVVIKGDYQVFSVNSNNNRLNLGLGWSF